MEIFRFIRHEKDVKKVNEGIFFEKEKMLHGKNLFFLFPFSSDVCFSFSLQPTYGGGSSLSFASFSRIIFHTTFFLLPHFYILFMKHDIEMFSSGGWNMT